MNHYRQSPAKGVRYGLPAIAAIALAFSIVSVIEGHPGRKAIPPPIVPPESPFADSIAGLGVVEPNSEMVLIASELSGVINRVYVVDGQRVRTGETLFSLDAREYKSDMEDAEATVDAHRRGT